MSKYCSYCQGTGSIKCNRCNGSGKVSGSFNIYREFSCSKCGGSGTETCPNCCGQGYTCEDDEAD